MNSLPLISIIIPTYNRAHLIRETLNSVLAQTYQNWECIVVDDGSTDDTDTVLEYFCKKDKRFRYYHRSKPHLSGGNGARNYGFKKSKGEYIQWFDSDDLMCQNYLESKINQIQLTDLDYLVTNFYKLISKKIIKSPPLIIDNKIVENYLLQEIFINLMSIIFKRKSIKSICFDEKLKNAQDLDFISRYLVSGTKKGQVRNVYNFKYRLHTDNITSKHKNKDVKSMLTDLTVRKQNLKFAQNQLPHIFKKLKYKLLVKTLKLGKVNKVNFYKFIWELKTESFIGFFEFVKIILFSFPYIYTKKIGKELFKRAIINH